MWQFISGKKIFIFSFVIFCLSLWLRTHRLSDIYVFNFDEEYQATYAWTLVQHFHRIWIGVSAAFLDFYLGPYFTYLSAILLGISKGDPIFTGFLAAIYGAILSVIIFVVGWRFFNFITGVVASILYTTLPIFVFYDQKYWNPMFSSLVVLFMFVSLNLITKSKWWWLLYAGAVGAMFHSHLSPAPLILIGIFYFIRGRFWKDLRLLLFCSIVFLFFYWPLLVFDYYHNWSNLSVFFRFPQQAQQAHAYLNPLGKLNAISDSLGRFWYLKPQVPNADEINFGCSAKSISTGYQVIDKYTLRTYPSFWLSFISVSLFLLYLLNNIRSKDFPKKQLALFLLVSAFFYLIYPGGAYEYYILPLLTLFTFVPAIFISSVIGKRQFLLWMLIVIIALLGINTVIQTSDEFSIGPKKILISKVMAVIGDQPFSIEGRGICHNYEGWRYLFKVYGRLPNQSYTDATLGWLYPGELNKQPVTYKVILSEDRIPLEEDLSKLYSIKEGGYRAYIQKIND